MFVWYIHTCTHIHARASVCKVPASESDKNISLLIAKSSASAAAYFISSNPNLGSVTWSGTDCTCTCNEIHYWGVVLKLGKLLLHSPSKREKLYHVESLGRREACIFSSNVNESLH